MEGINVANPADLW